MSHDASLNAAHHRARIAVACSSDPSNRALLSGMPANFLDGLAAVGVEGVPLWVKPQGAHALTAAAARVRTTAQLAMGGDPLSPKERARRAVRATRQTQSTARHLTRSIGEQLDAIGPIDGVVQLSSDFILPEGVRYATLSDQTARQALGAGVYAHYEHLSLRERAAWVARESVTFQRAVACCVRSHAAAHSIVDDYGIARGKVHTVGVGSNRAFPAGRVRDWSLPRFLFVGLEWDRKNGQMVVEAFRAVRAAWPGAELHLVGKHPAIDEPGVVRHGRLRLDDPAQRAALDELYLQATALVMPSLWEPAGIAYAEASHAGIASIGGNAGGASTIVRGTGILIDPTARDALQAAMLAMADPVEAARRGRLAYERAPLHTWAAVAARVVRALGLPQQSAATDLVEAPEDASRYARTSS